MQTFIINHFSLLLKASCQAAVLILLVLAAQWIFGRQLKPRWRHALWLLVIVRLALPWTISSPASLFNFLDVASAPASLAAKWKLHFAPHSASTHSTAATPAQQNTEAVAPASAGTSPANLGIRWMLGVWAAGVLALALALSISHFRLSRRMSLRRPLIDARVLNLLEDCKQQMGVRAPVTLVETPEVGSPTLFGFVRPRLLLPAGLTRDFSPEELRYVFLHELSHIKRHDILLGWLMTALQILHWFNPFVWLASSRMRVDRELACDALALSFARDEENQRYGQTIIKLLENFGRSAWAPSMAGAVENQNQLKERIRMIAKYRKTNRGLTLAVALIAGLGLVTLTDASPESSELAKDLIGTWVLVGSPDAPGAAPAVGARYKTFTDKTFSVTQADPKTGSNLFHHGGAYTLEGDKLTTSVKFVDGAESNLLKQTFIFKIGIKGDTYTQTGVKNPWNEVWKRVNPDSPKPHKLETAALEGTWRGHDTGPDDNGETSLMIHGSNIEFHEANTNDWLKATFSVYDTTPKQLVAVVTDCPSADIVGMPVFAIYQMEDGKLTVAGFPPGSSAVPAKFDATGARKIVFTKN